MVSGFAATLTNHFLLIASSVNAVAWVMGVGMFIGGFYELKKYGETRTMMSSQMSIAGPLVMILSGVLLIVLPNFIGTALLAFWGDASPLSYQGSTDGYSALIPPILIFVRIIGVGSFIRGIVLLARSGGHHGQPGSLGKALIHMLAGLLCVHILGTIDLLKELLGM
ncbi:MAG: type IV secretion protein IcmC [Gammaproteobacteria bacterium CG_4_10_14_0_8_um_filter_38_16]|nr:MAG: type IV secretion protein IcmC [Gammaproteobacteria bacterium CG_4_10_14_0_8_um_filter_38_16]PJA04398.1 MAG: type IV secretion protein IcmC [Gammaproteobacteria bacterium CG_4_10_14_0_2_um_filter_38_22]PJB10181.1 MAG: type IV secretion protein IcmC [Gammaproteobacteria bacterium CG_4_9_14_3_um_filter_38_9]